MALRKIHNTFYVYFRDLDGRLKTRSLKTTDPDLAKSLHSDYMLQLQARRGRAVILRDFPELAPPPDQSKPSSGIHQRGGIRISEMWDCASQKRALGKAHKEAWNLFEKRIKLKYADQVTPAIALDYLQTYFSKGNGKTFNNNKSILNTIFRCCLIEAGINESPFKPIVNKRVLKVSNHRNLSLDEFNLIMKNSPPVVQVMAMLSRWTAQRLETCARITPEMFDLNRKVIIIDPGKTRRFGKWVCCPIMPDLEKFILDMFPEFENPNTKNIPFVNQLGYTSNNAFSMCFTRLLKRLGIKSNDSGVASFHSLRGTAITWFQEHGIKGEDLRHITGHESASVEDIYARDIASVSNIAKSFFSM